jgi:apolipoprotein D and lipocalin family protein
MQNITASLTLFTLLFASAANLRAQQVTAVPKLDENTLVGVWYQVARIPTKRALKKCKSDMLEVIAPGEKRQLQIVDSCTSPKGYTDASNRTYKRDKALDGRLKTGFFPLSSKYWIVAQQPDWFLAGTPNHRYLWIYSKTATMPPSTRMQIEAQASSQGFQVQKLVSVVQ